MGSKRPRGTGKLGSTSRKQQDEEDEEEDDDGRVGDGTWEVGSRSRRKVKEDGKAFRTAPGAINVEEAWSLLNTKFSRLDHGKTSTLRAVDGEVDKDANGAGWVRLGRGEGLPRDLSIKSHAKILAAKSLDWCVSASAKVESDAVETTSTTNGFEAKAEASIEGWACALLHYRHPGGTLPPGHAKRWGDFVANRAVSEDFLVYARARLTSWEEALRSLFYRLRARHIDSFYVRTATNLVVFLNDPVTRGICVGVTGGTPGFIELLKRAGIQYSSHAVDGIQDALLSVRQADDAHALYEFTLGQGFKIGSPDDVPELLCERPFVGGILHRCRVGPVLRSVRISSGLEIIQWSVEIRDALLPGQLNRVRSALEQHPRVDDFEILLQTPSWSRFVNIISRPVRNFAFASSSKSSNPIAESDSGYAPRTIQSENTDIPPSHVITHLSYSASDRIYSFKSHHRSN